MKAHNFDQRGHRRRTGRAVMPFALGHVPNRRVGIAHQALPGTLNHVELSVLLSLGETPVRAVDIASAKGLTTGQVRRALGTLRSLRLAQVDRDGQTNVWTRA